MKRRPERRPPLPNPVAPPEAPAPGAGTLYVVGTPLGNLGDLSPRARSILGLVGVLAAEDTRVARHLLRCCEIETVSRFVSYREQNREVATAQLLDLLRQGLDVALVTDAGMPCISDPGDVLVAACHDAGVTVVPVPGPSAVLAALVSSGIAGPRFCFEGFLSRRASHRKEHLLGLRGETRTMVFFEAPSRVADTLGELARTFGGQRTACVARELTKKFEEIRRGPLDDLCAWADQDTPRGEFVLVVAGAPASGHRGEEPGALEMGAGALRTPAGVSSTDAPQDPKDLLASLMATGMSRRDAAREVATRLRLPRRAIYQLGLETAP